MTTKTTTTTMTKKRKRSPRPTRTHRPLYRLTPTHQQGGVQAPAGTLSKALLTPSLRVPFPAPVRSPPHVEFGPAEEPPRRGAGEQCSPGEAGKHLQEPSPQAVRAVPPAAASPPAWSIRHPSRASLRGQSSPHPADMSHLPPNEDLLPSDPFLLSFPFHPAATDRHRFQRLPRPWGCSTEPLGTYRGRTLVHQVVT